MIRTAQFILALALAATGSVRAAEKPNFLIISIDDLNDWVGCLGGHPQAQTPNIDRLAARGTLFTNAHCQAPICTPSRASMVTGLLPTTTGLYFLNPGLSAFEVARKQPTFMSVLAEAGYHTMSAGKFVHGSKEGKYFKEYGGGMGGFGPNAPEKMNSPHGGPNWDWGPYPESDAEMPDTKVADWVIERLEEPQENPFLLVAGFWRPHVPMSVPPHWFDRFPLDEVELPAVLEGDRDDLPPYAVDLTNGEPAPRHEWFVAEDKWRSAVQAYLASTTFVDHCVGRVLDALEASPHADDTVVILLSDHGWHLGEKERWAKRSLWNDGLRLPLIIAEPSQRTAQVTNRPAGLIDLYPTLLELAGLSPREELEGRSLVPLLREPQRDWPHPVITTYCPGNHSLRTTRWHYIRYSDGSEELYDHESDPHEWYNVAGRPEHRELIDGLQVHLPEDTEPARIKWWDRWEVADWMTAEANAKARAQTSSGASD